MASELPYLPTYKNVEKLFQKIATAKQPEAFTTRFLSDVIGLTSVGDRSLIALLKTLGFLDGAGRPTPAYAALKNPQQSARAIAAGVRRGYEPLFATHENPQMLSPDQLKGLVAQVAGSDAGTTTKIMGTLNALLRLSEFSGAPKEKERDQDREVDQTTDDREEGRKSDRGGPRSGLRPDFHYNIQVHLPANGTEEIYLNIFNALRRAFK